MKVVPKTNFRSPRWRHLEQRRATNEFLLAVSGITAEFTVGRFQNNDVTVHVVDALLVLAFALLDWPQKNIIEHVRLNFMVRVQAECRVCPR